MPWILAARGGFKPTAGRFRINRISY